MKSICSVWWAIALLLVLVPPPCAGFVGRGPRGGGGGASLTVSASRATTRQATTASSTTALYSTPKKAKATKKEPSEKEPSDSFKKSDFISAVAEQTGLSKGDSEMAMTAVFDILRNQVGAGKKVAVPGFGTFTLKKRAARKGRNPQTGQELDIAASQSPGFTPSKTWKDAINGR